MKKKPFQAVLRREALIVTLPTLALVILSVWVGLHFVNPAPSRHVVISTGDGEGDYETFAKQYQQILKQEGIDIELRSSAGAVENLQRLQDERSGVDVAFGQDGLAAADEESDVVSLGSLYYEPIWFFYRGSVNLTRFSDVTQLQRKRIAIGERGGGTHLMALQLLRASDMLTKGLQLVNQGMEESAENLHNAELDAGFFLARADDPLIEGLMEDPALHLMSVDQADAVTKQLPFLHHLKLSHGSINLGRNIPQHDIDMLATTATLLVRDTLHPALMFLLLKAANLVHSEPGMFETKGEFPVDKDYQFPLSDEAKQFYKSGMPFWQHYLPFWLASLIDRFLLIALPVLALLFPSLKLVPRYLTWRVRSRIYQRYGELKYLETQIRNDKENQHYQEHLSQLDLIEDRVNHMKVPLEFTDHLYVLREHIDFVRSRLTRLKLQNQS